MPTDADIDFFFAAPDTPSARHSRGSMVSVLYLLRRELLDTQGYDPAIEYEDTAWRNGAKARLFASLSLMFTGFDLLAKFEQGDEAGVGRRFKAFLRSEHGGQEPESIANLLYGVRNSIIHAFGVPDPETLGDMGMTHIAISQRLVADTTMGATPVTVRLSGDVAEVYIDGVYRLFLSAKNRYRDSLWGDGAEEARERFDAMFMKYGTIRML